jgi:hypothetical protein
MLCADEIIELGKKFGFSTEVLGYSDVEAQLLKLATHIYVMGYNDAVRGQQELDFLEEFNNMGGWKC